MTILYHDIVGLSLLHGERLVFDPAAETATASASLCLFYHLAVHLERVAVIGGECIFHIAGEGCLILATDANGECVLADALGKAPRTEGREIQLVVVACRDRLAAQFFVIEKLYKHALAVVEVLQVVDSALAVGQLTGFLVEDVSTRYRIADAFEQ